MSILFVKNFAEKYYEISFIRNERENYKKTLLILMIF